MRKFLRRLTAYSLLYGVLYCANNLIYWNHPESQQHPTAAVNYLTLLADTTHPEPYLKFVTYRNTLREQEEETGRYPWHRRAFSPIQRNLAYLTQMADLENPEGNLGVVNSGGYMGKFQMGSEAFQALGVRMSPRKFKRHPLPEHTQDSLFLSFCALNKYYLQKEIDKYAGKRIRGVRLHQGNILAGAHLGGASSMKRYLLTHGRYDFADGNGTHVSYYLRRFENKRLDLRGVKQPLPND
jgi:hypothetical protein